LTERRVERDTGAGVARPTTIVDLVEGIARERAGEPAIGAPGRPPLDYDGLLGSIRRTAAALRARGIGPDQRVAVVLRDGPELANAFLSISAAAGFCPLNPAYRRAEFEFYLTDLHASLLIVERGVPSEARDAAHALGVPMAELDPLRDEAAGLFTLEGAGADAASEPPPSPRAQPDQTALVLHTSGTTSRPKMVPLSHANLCASARNITATLHLAPGDRCLNVMPLFHIHGLIAATLSSIASGATVFCTTGFDLESFFGWVEACRPTWWTAVPTMHHAILERAARQKVPPLEGLRFLRSSSASLPPKVMADLEARFGVPVIEAYGMTEGSHQICSNPLPPAARKPGSVGLPVGTRVAALDEAGNVLPPGERGEISIQGENVTRGYEANPKANEQAFTNGWFRTGDQGLLDEDGYVFLTGRLKEIINRGGEKVSPREVDEVLLEHPDVAQVVTFALPHPSLGEDVAAAVVRRPNAAADPDALRAFVAKRLAPFKVPGTIVLIDKIPKGPTGKLQRIGLASLLAEQLAGAHVAPRTDEEALLAAVYARVLDVQRVSVRSSFASLGGDSISAVRISSEAANVGLSFSAGEVLELQTIERLAAATASRTPPATAARTASGPIEAFGLERELFYRFPRNPDFHHFTTELAVTSSVPVDVERLAHAMRAVIGHHDAFRLRADLADRRSSLRLADEDPPVDPVVLDLSGRSGEEQARRIAETTEAMHRELDLDRGPVLRLLVAQRGDGRPDHIVLVVHHFIADRFSCGILFDDLGRAYRQLGDAEAVSLPPSRPLREFRERIFALVDAGALDAGLDYWRALNRVSVPLLLPELDGANNVAANTGMPLDLSAADTAALAEGARRQGASFSDLMLAAVAYTAKRRLGGTFASLGVLGHGRAVLRDFDVSRTVGSFIYTVPVVLNVAAEDPAASVCSIGEQFRRVPDSGVAISALLGSSRQQKLREIAGFPRPQILVNWRGVLSATSADPRAPFTRAEATWPRETMWRWIASAKQSRDPYLLHVDAEIWEGGLRTTWYYGEHTLRRETVEGWGAAFVDELHRLSGSPARAS
jgi:acyl-CoA synthetase (AMP-forming)/AMP-acid ligase II